MAPPSRWTALMYLTSACPVAGSTSTISVPQPPLMLVPWASPQANNMMHLVVVLVSASSLSPGEPSVVRISVLSSWRTRSFTADGKSFVTLA
ncbi:hypothetical protein PF005_g13551 [Phytophthora fragariae]|uniref:Secreted protein n=1 Tax=Phytophthora fragariae TaxID=53985 RepID=A0A6A3JC15_9STRA|nr:hypothetical protein PF009_g16316 [Phytophthora fragariae]KAE8989895.1 hypothetical protein PF011_g18579 [Phytophthora fragariae]KAE9088834.1 hypothetical protein PF007_g19827 [Phytophthora fragariae]KAE9089736.1 hypothetical protein PF010_g18871 [Phytophthora fragariae]KAE9116294.1 hypothetical protein PF006_g19074 [Phytophthora fragariae]